MRLLALETSGRTGSAALLAGDAAASVAVVEERAAGGDARTAQSLLPCIDELLKRHGWKSRELDAIAVAAGPGSFTGLRVGVVTAKTLAYATGAKLVGVKTLSVIAAGVVTANFRQPVWAILDAQRQELFAARFERNGELALEAAAGPDARIIPVADWLSVLQLGEIVAGPPLVRLAAQLPAHVVTAPESSWAPTAAGVGRLGARLLAAGRESDVMSLVPDYLRASAAEEEAMRSLGS